MEMSKRRNNNKSMTYELSLEEVLEAIKHRNKNRLIKDMNGITLLHPVWHLKETSRIELQTMFNETCKDQFQYSLNMEKWMTSYHDPDDLRKLITPSSLKYYEFTENSANYNADEAGM